MINRNAYFQIEIRDNGTYLMLFAPVGNGSIFTYNELNNYLVKNNLNNYDIHGINNVLRNFNKDGEVRLTISRIFPINEYMMIRISENKMSATVRFYPPSNGGNKLTKEDIILALNREKVSYGIKENIIEEFIKNRQYCVDYTMAEGKFVKQGKNASIVYHFNIDLTKKPKTNEDGSVNFHQLDLINHCKKGDLLATLIPEVNGESGFDVYGNRINPAKVQKRILKKTKNVIISGDGLNMYADVDGHILFDNNEVNVSNVFEIKGNIDNSTGDVDYYGDVVIRGNVLTGFSVKAHGNIDIDGVVEGATLIAGGHIIIKRGMQGMNRGVLDAGGNIIAKFIENATVKCFGYISTESIMHSHVSATGEITVGGRRGFISGGKIRSGKSISAKNVGSTMGTATLLEVGLDPTLSEEYSNVEKELNNLYHAKEKLSQGVIQIKNRVIKEGKITDELKAYLRKLVDNNNMIESQIQILSTRNQEIMKVMENTMGHIIVFGTAYPGTTLIISGITSNIRDEVMYSKFVREGADIRILPI